MKNTLRLSLFNKLLLALIVFAQATVYAQPLIQWERSFQGVGGNTSMTSMLQTSDGGYLLAGSSNASAGGDKSESSRGGSDYWVIKLRADRSIEWERIYGGLRQDMLKTAVQTSDGGYLLGGESASDIGYEKSEPYTGKEFFGDYPPNFWVIKIDANGNKQWDRTLGGSGGPFGSAKQTPDGGYIIGGSSNTRYTVIKLDSFGNKIWEKFYRGAGGYNLLRSITPTSDGGYILVGNSDSQVGYDKSESSKRGIDDYWIIKIDGSGVAQWDKTYGGSGLELGIEATQINDGGYIITGLSDSPADDVKTETNRSFDTWVLKLSNNGSLEWEKTLGGSQIPQDPYIASTNIALFNETTEGNLVFGGYSSGKSSPDKTQDITGAWMVTLSKAGKIVADTTFAYKASIFKNTTDGGFVIGGGSTYQIRKYLNGAPQPPTTIRINAGGPDFTTATKKLFIADKYYDEPGRVSSIVSGAILNTTNDVLYQSARCSSSFGYSIPVVNGEVNVTLHFAETYFGVPGTRGEKGGEGSRQFHVNMEGSRKLTNYDIFASAGGAMRANQITIPVTVTDGVLNLVFLTGAADLPKVCAIEVLPAQVQTLTFTPEADATVRNGIYKEQNFGSDQLLGVKGGNGNTNRKTYLRFRVPNVSIVKSAKLRVYGYNHESASGAPIGVGGVFNDAWTESGITFSNAPGHQNPALGSRTSVRGELKYYDMDVTDFVRSQVAGDKVVSLAIVTAYNNNLIYIHSKENPSGFAPQLVIETTTAINTAARLSNENEEVSNNNTAPGSIIYPNPAKDHIMLEISSNHKSNVDLNLTNMTGHQFQLQHPEMEGSASRLKVGLPGQLPAGMYLLKVQSKEFSEVLKVLVTEQ